MYFHGIKVPSARLYEPLEKKQLKLIHRASLELLEDVGIEVSNKKALDLFCNNGANADRAKNRVFLPRDMVEEAISTAPSKVLLAGRNEKYDLHLEKFRVYMGGGGVSEKLIDLESGAKRNAVIEDIVSFARLADALGHVHFQQFMVIPPGLPAKDRLLYQFYHILKNTGKHVMGGVISLEELEKVVKLGEIICGGRKSLQERPPVSFINCLMISPLRMDCRVADLVMETAAQGLPQAIPTAPTSGVTAPITLAGTTLMQNTEALAGIVLTQLVNPGAPVLYSTVSSVVDMFNLSFMFGAVELGVLAASGAQMARYYDIPMYGTGGATDSKFSDQQAGFEKALTLLTAALGGVNIVHDTAGQLESITTVGYEQMVIDNEVNGMVCQIIRGVDFSEERLAKSVISEVGPGGNFLTTPHTIKYLRTEHYNPRVSDRLKESAWIERGMLDLRSRARVETQRILETNADLSFDEDVRLALAREFPRLVD